MFIPRPNEQEYRRAAMALSAFILDVDGTLIDSNAMHVEAFRRAFAKRGYQIPNDRLAVEIGKGGDQLIPALIGEAAYEKDGKALKKLQPEEFKTLAAGQGLKVFQGVRNLLTELRRRKITIVVATSSGKAQLETLTKYSGLEIEKDADLIVNADDISASKPAPDLVAAAVKKSGLSPAQCVMVGDTPYDATSAKHAGVITLGMLCGGVGMTELSLREAGARRCYRNPLELLNHLDEALHVASPGSIQLSQAVLDQMMDAALQAARDAMADGEVPIGAALFRGDGTLIATGYNRLNKTLNKTAHAEMVAFANAAGKYDVSATDSILVSTLEPCVMCTGAAMEAAVDTIVYGLKAPPDAGTGRVIPPVSAETQMPRIVGDVRSSASLDFLNAWYAINAATPQAKYVGQLLKTVEA